MSEKPGRDSNKLAASWVLVIFTLACLVNSKPEARNPEQILNTNVPMIKTKIQLYITQVIILFWSFEFW
jgi:hypothetical protein